MYSFNQRDYMNLHTTFLGQGQSHAGIILARKDSYSIGEQMRRLIRLINAIPAEEMKNRVEFLGAWSDNDGK